MEITNTNPPANPPLLMTDGDGVCSMIGVGVSKFHGMKRGGKFPVKPIRLGRAVRYRIKDVELWVEHGCPNSERWRAILQARKQ